MESGIYASSLNKWFHVTQYTIKSENNNMDFGKMYFFYKYSKHFLYLINIKLTNSLENMANRTKLGTNNVFFKSIYFSPQQNYKWFKTCSGRKYQDLSHQYGIIIVTKIMKYFLNAPERGYFWISVNILTLMQ